MLSKKYLLRIYTMVCCCLIAYHGISQKYDYNLLNRSTPHGSGISISYSDSTDILDIQVVEMAGTVSGGPILSDSDGRFLGYFNSRNLYDSIDRIAVNGDSMAVGFFQNYLFQFLPEHEGLGDGGNSAFIPINDSLYYLFYKSSELWAGAPDFALDYQEKGKRITSYSENLYLTKVRLRADKRLYILPNEKHLILEEDLFQFKNLMLCKHANGSDWWLIIPKARNSMASRFLVHANGEIESFSEIEFSSNFWRVRSTTEFRFNAQGDYLARLIVRPDTLFEHLLEIFSFNRCDGLFQLEYIDSFPLPELYTNAADIEFSDNGSFLYLALGSIILQIDYLDHKNNSTPDTIAVWDGYIYFGFLHPIFDALWKLPNGKILVASAVSTPFLHYIHQPNLKGDSCLFEQRAIQLPDDPLNLPFGVDIEKLPKFPPYRMNAIEEPCITDVIESLSAPEESIYPNPATDFIIFKNHEGKSISIININGQELISEKINLGLPNYKVSVQMLSPGIYFILTRSKQNGEFSVEKLVKI